VRVSASNDLSLVSISRQFMHMNAMVDHANSRMGVAVMSDVAGFDAWVCSICTEVQCVTWPIVCTGYACAGGEDINK
jgi:hypothetical protein